MFQLKSNMEILFGVWDKLKDFSAWKYHICVKINIITWKQLDSFWNLKQENEGRVVRFGKLQKHKWGETKWKIIFRRRET